MRLSSIHATTNKTLNFNAVNSKIMKGNFKTDPICFCRVSRAVAKGDDVLKR